MTDIDKVLEAARRVEQIRAELKVAEANLLAVRGGTAPKTPPPRAAAKPEPKGASVSQRVLRLVIDSGPAGVARKEIVASLGKAREIAVHSALKVHQTKGRIANEDGRWVATASLVRKLQTPGAP